MPINLSAANRSAVAAMTLIDQQMLATQNNLSTGNAINSAGDDPIKYFRSVDLTSRAKYLKSVAQNTDFALANIKAADKTLSQIKDQMTTLQSTINAARGTPQAATPPAIATQGTRAFQPTTATASRIAPNALASAAEAQTTGQSLVTTARNKAIFDDNGGNANGVTDSYNGNLGLAPINGTNLDSARVRMQINIGTDTVTVDVGRNDASFVYNNGSVTTLSPATASRSQTVGDLVDRVNEAIGRVVAANSGSKLAGTVVSVDQEGRFRIDTAATGADRVKLGFSYETLATPFSAANTGVTIAQTRTLANALGLGVNVQNPNGTTVDWFDQTVNGTLVEGGFGVDARQATAYDASLIGAGLDAFQEGDTFSIALTDRAGNSNRFFFRATARDKMNVAEQGTGLPNAPIKFSSVGDLVDAINSKFNNATGLRLTASYVAGGAGLVNGQTIAPQFSLRLQLGDANTQLRIEQTQNADTNFVDQTTSANGAGTLINRKIAANNLVSIFGVPTLDATGASGMTTRLSSASVLVDATNPANLTRTTEEYQTLTWAMPAAAGAIDPKRVAARQAFVNTVMLMDEILRSAKLDMGGQPNLLNAEEQRIQLAENNSRAYSIRLGARVDRNFLQIPWNDFDFGNDTAIDTVSNNIATGLNNITTVQATLASHTVALKSFSSFYGDLSSLYQTTGEDIVKADMNEESNKLKALQTMQQITQAVMGINNQLEQGVARLLY